MWKSTKSIGCAIEKRKTKYKGKYYDVGFVVAQYSPGGNVKSQNHQQTQKNYNLNVQPLLKTGSKH